MIVSLFQARSPTMHTLLFCLVLVGFQHGMTHLLFQSLESRKSTKLLKKLKSV